jgi:hypothetical protein
MLVSAAIFPIGLFSQEWSQEQKEAWAVIEKIYNAWEKRDVDGYLSYLHKNFIGWYDNDPLPLNKESLRGWENHWLSTTQIIRNEIRPVSIAITADTAIINYYATSLRKDEQGNKLAHHKWTDVLKKEDGKWLVLGSFGGKI